MRLFIFGDSYSIDYDADCLKVKDRMSYVDWKGYVPKKYYDIIAEEYNISEIYNYSLCGNDNGNIFETFMDEYDKITEDDFVIFGWTSLSRFSICNAEPPTNKQPKYKPWGSSVSHSKLDWVEKAQLNFNTILFYDRQIKLISHINKTTRANKIVHWTWYYPNNQHHSTIINETNGIVEDYHYNESAHLELAKNMIEELKSKNVLEMSLWNKNKLYKVDDFIFS